MNDILKLRSQYDSKQIRSAVQLRVICVSAYKMAAPTARIRTKNFPKNVLLVKNTTYGRWAQKVAFSIMELAKREEVADHGKRSNRSISD